MSFGATRVATRSPAYGSSGSYYSSYNDRYSTMPTRKPTSTYQSYVHSYASRPTEPSYASRGTDYTSSYSSSYGTTTRSRTPSATRTPSASRARTRSPSRGRDEIYRSHISSPIDRGRPTDSVGRPLPKGPGTRDRYGNPVNPSDHLSTLRSTLQRNGSRESSVTRRPLRAEHTYKDSSHSLLDRDSDTPRLTRDSDTHRLTRDSDTHRLTKGKRTSSVADLTTKFETLDLKTSRKYGSNADLSAYSSPRGTTRSSSEDLAPYRSKQYRTTSVSSSSDSPLPDISITNKTSRSPSLESMGGRKSDMEEESPATKRSYGKSTISRRDSISSITNGYSSGITSDHLNNNKGLVGLRNIGNTCFMNSVLQCLSNTRPLLEFCMKDAYTNDVNSRTSSMKGQLVKVYANVMKSLWESGRDNYITPSEFKSQIAKFAKRFVGYNQQDAQEFLIYLLEGLHEDLNRVTEKKKRIIDDSNDVETISASEKAKQCWNRYLDHDNSKIIELFVGQLRSTLTCTVCDYASNTFDPFWDLSLPISKGSRFDSASLTDCLDLFTTEESLEGDERPTCAKCRKRQRCRKRFSIQRFPKVLVIHLKRFSQGSYYRSKLSTTVDFPMTNLDLSSYSADNRVSAVYNLYAVVNHSGSTGGGHYTAYTKNPYSGEWHHFNDQRVSSMSKNRIVSSEAYVLFYELQGNPSHL